MIIRAGTRVNAEQVSKIVMRRRYRGLIAQPALFCARWRGAVGALDHAL